MEACLTRRCSRRAERAAERQRVQVHSDQLGEFERGVADYPAWQNPQWMSEPLAATNRSNFSISFGRRWGMSLPLFRSVMVTGLNSIDASMSSNAKGRLVSPGRK